MARMTEEEAAALDNLLTRTTPRLTGIPGVFARQKILLEALDSVAANYIRTKAEATHQTPAEIIGQLVRKELAETAEFVSVGK
ncbi:MAG: hypothetical protein LBG22_10410 [Treponema sp.]|nr:hypothetical protein [Treponema sp.]